MNSPRLKRFVLNSKRDILEEFKGFDLRREKREELAYRYFMGLVSLKYLDENQYFLSERQVFLKAEENQDIELIRSSMEELEDLFPSIYSRELRQLYSKKLFTTYFYRELNDESLIGPDDWKSLESLGIIYENYIADENQRVIGLKRRYRKEELGLATQLFTPRWLVKYMVENSLGRFWLENNGPSERLLRKMDYYIEGDRSDLRPEKTELEELKCFDPAMGTGNILVYIFELLYELYLDQGYEKGQISRKIIENNIYGLEIDPRVYDIAYFSLLLKAEEYEEGFLRKIDQELKSAGRLRTNIYLIKEYEDLRSQDIRQMEELTDQKLRKFLRGFSHRKISGTLGRNQLYSQEIHHKLSKDFKTTEYEEIMDNFLRQEELSRDSYHVIVSNPPYVARRYMPKELKLMLEEEYPMAKSDLFAAFMVYGMEHSYENGHLGFMTPYVWMFISSYEDLRLYLIDNKNISSLVQLEYSGFSNATVPICSFSIRNYSSRTLGEYIKLSDFKGVKKQPLKTREAIENKDLDYRYSAYMEDYKKLPGSPIAYWADEAIYRLHERADILEDVASPRQGVATGNNKDYLRYWYQVDFQDIGFNYGNVEDFLSSGQLYAPYNKGGKYRKWYGNFDYVIKFNRENYEKLKKSGNKLPSKAYYFKEGISWSFVSSSYFGVRYSPVGSVFDVGGSSVFPEDRLYYILGLMCSKVSNYIMEILNPTLNFQVGDVKKLPFIYREEYRQEVDSLVVENIGLSKLDWDSYEISWDFRQHPLLRQSIKGRNLEESFNNWVKLTNENFEKLKANEERLNEIFLRIYGLDSKLSPRMDNRDITVTRIVDRLESKAGHNQYTMDRKMAFSSFLSFFVGRSLGRYTDDQDLVTNRSSSSQAIYNGYGPMDSLLFKDCFNKYRDFLIHYYGQEGLEENLEFSMELMGFKTRRDFNRYFKKDFLEDHEKLYRKFPIYKKSDNHSIIYRLDQ